MSISIGNEIKSQFRPPDGYRPGCLVATILLFVFTIIGVIGFDIGDFAAGLINMAAGVSAAELSMGPVGGTLRLLIILGLMWIGWFALRFNNPLKELGLVVNKRSIKDLVWGLAIGLAACAFAFATIAILGDLWIADTPMQSTDITYSRTFSWIAVIYMIFAYATAEEIMFRGFLYPWMKKCTGLIYAMLSTSLIFSLFHLGNPGFLDTPFPLANIILASVFLTLLRELTGSLWLAMGAHFSWNFVLVATGVPVSGIVISIVPRNWYLITSGPDWITGGIFGPEGGLSGTVAMLIVIPVIWKLINNRKRER